jgi:hypothetical protein
MVRASVRKLRNDGGYGERIQRLGLPSEQEYIQCQASSSPKFARSETRQTREIEKKRDDLPGVKMFPSPCPNLPFPALC